MGVGGHGWLDSFWGYIVPNVMNPFRIFLLRQYMKSIPDELLDAARIDGAGHFRVYWRVVLPLSRPALAAPLVIVFFIFQRQFVRGISLSGMKG